MSGLEKMSKSPELAESKKKIMEQSVLSLFDKFKDLEGQLELTRKNFSGVSSELDVREKKLNSEKESLELTRKSVEQRFKDVGNREKDFELFREKKIRDLKMREDELVRIRKEVDEELSEKEKGLQELMTKFKSERIQNEELNKFVEERFKEMGFEEKSLNVKREEIELIRTSIEARIRELEHKEREIKERKKEVEGKEEELYLWKARYDEAEMKEKESQLMIEDLELQERNNDYIRRLNEKKMKELDVKEKDLEEKLKQHFYLEERGSGLEKGLRDLESKRKEFQEEVEGFELRKKELQESVLDLESKRNKFEEEIDGFELRKKEFQESVIDFLSEKNSFEKASKILEVREKEFGERTKKLEVGEKVLKESLKGFHLKQAASQMEKERLEKESEDLDSKRKEFEQMIEEFNRRKKVFEESFQSEKNLLEKDSKHLESRRKELEKSIKKFELREKEFESKEKQFQLEKKIETREKELELKENELKSVPDQAHLETEQIQVANGQSSLSNYIDLNTRYMAMMDGKDLQIFLNEQQNHDLIVDKLLEALQMCKDPAKLVLNAMEGFFPPHLRKDNKTFSSSVVRKSCMLLLRQLIRISPHIQPCVRDEALKLAREWKAKIVNRSSLEAHCFLYLLASYNVADAFDAGDVIRCLKFTSLHYSKLEPEMCRRLGLQDKIPNLIENLLQSNQSLQAVKFIYSFEVVDRFPPVPILKSYLDHVKMSAFMMLRERGSTKEAQNEYIDTRVAAIRSVVRCVIDYKLESQFSLKNLENTEKQLLIPKGGKKFTGYSNFHEARGEQNIEVKQISSTAAPSQPDAPRLAANLSDTFKGAPRPMPTIIANMDGKNFSSAAAPSQPDAPRLAANLPDTFKSASCPMPTIIANMDGNNFPSAAAPSQPDAPRLAANLPDTFKSAPCPMPTIIPSAAAPRQPDAPRLAANLPDTFKSAPCPMPTIIANMDGNNFSSTAAPSQPDAPRLAANLSDTFKGAPHPMTIIVASMDGKNLLSFLSSQVAEHELLRNEVSYALQISDNSPKLVLDVVESFYFSHQSEKETKSCIFLLEQLMGLSPDVMPDVKEASQKIALNLGAQLKANNGNLLLTSMFLLLVSSYRLTSTFRSNELLDLYQRVAEQKPSPGLFHDLRISGEINNADAPRSQVETQNLKNLTVSSHMVPNPDDEFLCTNMDSEERETISVSSEIPICIYRSSDPADLVLDAMRYCYWSIFTKNNIPVLIFKSFCRLLEQLGNLSVGIKPHIKGRAYEFARDWKAKSNSIVQHCEALGFLQLVASYQLSSGFSSDELFEILESVSPPKKTSNFIRMFGLVDKVPEFVSQLINKKKLIDAFDYVYEFNLIEMFPPVALLKQHVTHSKLNAKTTRNEANTPNALDDALARQIGNLRMVVKRIRQRGLKSEYPFFRLVATIKRLERERARLKTSMQKMLNAPGLQMQNANTNKRPAYDAMDAICTGLDHLQQPANKIPRLMPPS